MKKNNKWVIVLMGGIGNPRSTPQTPSHLWASERRESPMKKSPYGPLQEPYGGHSGGVQVEWIRSVAGGREFANDNSRFCFG